MARSGLGPTGQGAGFEMSQEGSDQRCDILYRQYKTDESEFLKTFKKLSNWVFEDAGKVPREEDTHEVWLARAEALLHSKPGGNPNDQLHFPPPALQFLSRTIDCRTVVANTYQSLPGRHHKTDHELQNTKHQEHITTLQMIYDRLQRLSDKKWIVSGGKPKPFLEDQKISKCLEKQREYLDSIGC